MCVALGAMVAVVPAASAAEAEDGSSGSSDVLLSSVEYSSAGSSIFGLDLPVEQLTPFLYSLGLVDALTYARWKYRGTTQQEAKACFERLYPGQPYVSKPHLWSADASKPAGDTTGEDTPDPRFSLVDEDGSIKPCSPIELDNVYTLFDETRRAAYRGLLSSSLS